MGTASALARAQDLEGGRRARVVRHASLRPACADDAAQMRFAVEDALNTADFGDAGRLVLVRRLRLADLPPRASPAWVAHALEEAWRALARHAVPAVHPSAARADAVFFASRLAARIAWLAKVAAGQAPVEWFWPAALPELKGLPPASRAAAIERVMDEALRESAPAVVNALKVWDAAPLVTLARALPPRAQRRLLQVLVSSQAPARPGAIPGPVTRAPAAHAFLPAPLAGVARRLASWAPLDEAPAELLAALWLEPVLRRLPSREEVRAVASRALGRAGPPMARPQVAHAGPESPARTTGAHPVDALVPRKQAADAPPDAAAAGPARRRGALQPALAKIESGLHPRPQPMRKGAPAPPMATAPRLAAQPAWPWLADAAFTRFGGLMLVLNVLSALRFGRWLERVDVGEAHDFVRALLVHCLDRAGAPEDDPQRLWLGPSPGPLDAIRLWTLRLRRTLRRHARMDLADLVRRPAHVGATETHVDVIFSLDDVDMRLRRLGLDADPGWVPWFGRIVHLHFIDAQLLLPSAGDPHG